MAKQNEKPPHEYLQHNGVENLEKWVDEAKDWAVIHGFIMRHVAHQGSSDRVTPCPLALLPSPFPRRLWRQAIDVQQDMNLLYFRVSFDYDFLCSSLADVVKTDEFTRRQLDIYKAVCRDRPNKRPAQTLSLQIQRSDYMCHCPNTTGANGTAESGCSLKQIEVNSIASSMGVLAECSWKFHQYLGNRLGWSEGTVKDRLPENRPANTIVQGLLDAWYAYGNHKAIVLFITQGTENANISDQRQIEYRLRKETRFRCDALWRSLTECDGKLTLTDDLRLLLTLDCDTNSQLEVAVVYFRGGYVPSHYPTEGEWNTRLLIEQSLAIKSPWIGLQLANTKKVQQVLAKRDVLKRFLPEEGKAERVAETFAGLWGLERDRPETNEIVDKARRSPHDFVLKPQLEGGGSNIYGEAITAKLDALSDDEREAYILMERIQPLVIKNCLIRPPKGDCTPSVPRLSECVSELGVYGYLLGDGGNASRDGEWVRRNSVEGHLLRTKEIGVDEGGIMAGAAVIDSPYLLDEHETRRILA